MRKAYYIDTFSIGHVHEMFDASSLTMFTYIYDEMEYRASLSSKLNVETIMGGLPPSVNYKRLRIPHTVNKLGLIIRQIIATIYNFLYIITKSRKYDIIINYNTLLSIYPIKYATLFSSHKVFVICHGEMKELEGGSNINFLTRLSFRFFTSDYNKIPHNLYFFALSKLIKENICRQVSSQIAEKFYYFYHSAIFKPALVKTKCTNKIVIGMTGSLRESKGFVDFLEIANHFKSNPNIEFRAIGSLRTDPNFIKKHGVILPECVKKDYFLSRDDMYKEILELDYVLYLFPSDIYKYTASGSVYDAIDCEVPIIALKNDFFLDLFNLCGEFGIMADSKDGIKTIISNLDKKEKKYDFAKIKRLLSPQYVASSLQKQINF